MNFSPLPTRMIHGAPSPLSPSQSNPRTYYRQHPTKAPTLWFLYLDRRLGVSQDCLRAAPARQLVSCFLEILCVCVSSQGAGVTTPRRKNTKWWILFFFPGSPHLSRLKSGCQWRGERAGVGGKWQQNPVPSRPVLQLLPQRFLHRRSAGHTQQGPLSPAWPCRCLIEPSPPPTDLIKGSPLMLPSRPPSIFGHG